MTEYLCGAIRLDADYENNFSVTLTDDEGKPVIGNLILVIGDYKILGNYDSSVECYNFTVPAGMLFGKHEYQFVLDEQSIVFPEMMYFV